MSKSGNGFLAAIVVVAVLVVACSGATPAAQSGAAPAAQSSVAAETVLTYVSSALTASLDPDPQDTAAQSATYGLVFGAQLFRFDLSKGTESQTITEVEPELAQTVTMSADNKTMTLALRTTKSEAGNPLTAEDVKWTFDRIIANKLLNLNNLKNNNFDVNNLVTVVNPQTIQLRLTSPSPAAQLILAGSGFTIIDSVEAKKHVTAADPWAKEWLTLNSASFGPYRVESIEPLKQTVLVANPNYFRGVAPIKKVISRQLADTASLTQLAVTGGADYIRNIPFDQLKAVEAAGKMKLYGVAQTAVTILGVQVTRPKLSDPRVRQAVSLAVDRQGIANVYSGYAKPLTGCAPSTLVMPAAEKPLQATPNVAAAKQLLAAAGYPNGFDASVSITPANPGTPEAARVVQTNLAAIGITLKINTLATFAEFSAAQANAVDDFYMRNPETPTPDPGAFFNRYYSRGPAGSENKYKNDSYDSAVEKALSTVGNDRTPALKTLCELMLTDYPVILLSQPLVVHALKPNIKGFKAFPNQAPRFYNLSF